LAVASRSHEQPVDDLAMLQTYCRDHHNALEMEHNYRQCKLTDGADGDDKFQETAPIAAGLLMAAQKIQQRTCK